MSLSIRNRLTGTVTEITSGAAMGTVAIDVTGGQRMTAAVTMDAIKDLSISVGSVVDILIKSTEVSLATGAVSGISIRNQLSGTVSSLETGGAMVVAHIVLDGGGEITAAITRAAATDLGLASGSTVIALIKSTEVALSTA